MSLGLLTMVLLLFLKMDTAEPELAALETEFLIRNGISEKERSSIEKRIAELRDLRVHLDSYGKVWLDNLLPNLRDGNEAFDGCAWMTSRQIYFIIEQVKAKLEQPETDKDSQDQNPQNKSVEDKEEKPSRKRRKVQDFSQIPVGKWRNPIFYRFDGTHNKDEIQIIRSAIRHWQSQTCLRFFEFSPFGNVYFDHLIFSASMYGCISFVGKSNSKSQLINLHGKCLTKFGTPVHEIGHTLGLWHEHQRWDRDDYVRIVTNNIAKHKTQFWRQRTLTYDLPYDFGSIMHYGSKDGSVDGSTTIETLDPLYQQSIGQRIGLSFYDAKAINIAYCKNSCRRRLSRRCERAGYQDPNDCTRCRCPEGFGGYFCETVAPPVGLYPCGGIVDVSGEASILSSPGYTSPGFYDDKTECNWIVRAPKNYRLILSFVEEFGLYCHNEHICSHWVEIKYKGDLTTPGPRFCCNRRPRAVLQSDGPELVVIFRANQTTHWSEARRGFKIKVRADKMTKGEVDLLTNKLTQKEKNENKILPGTAWGKWGRCQNSECKCGGCSVSTRHSMCGKTKCMGEYARSQYQVCDRMCSRKDTYLNLSGNIIEMPCPVCCKGYLPKGDRCIPRN